MRRPLAWLLAVLVAGAAVVSAAGAAGVAGRPAGSPDLAAMALALADLPRGSSVASQGYYRDPDFVAAYEREFDVPGLRLGRSSLLGVFNDLSVERSDAEARTTFQLLRSLVGKKAFRTALAREIARELDAPASAVVVSRPRNVRIGDGAVALPMRIKAQGLTLYATILFLRVDRVLGTIGYFSFPGMKLYNADVDRLARSGAARMTAGLVPTLKAPPVLAGLSQPGQALSATTGTWTGDQLVFTYQWHRCDAASAGCALIQGATTASYTLGVLDLASTVRVTVVGRNRLGAVEASSVATAVVAGPAGSPTATAAPVVAGVAQAGATLTVDTGGWAGAPTAFAYQWRRCDAAGGACVDLAGATASTYTVASTDARSTLRVLVVATNAVGSGGAISAPTAAVP